MQTQIRPLMRMSYDKMFTASHIVWVHWNKSAFLDKFEQLSICGQVERGLAVGVLVGGRVVIEVYRTIIA